MGERSLQLAHRDHDAKRNIESVLELMTGLLPSGKGSRGGRRQGPAPQPRQPVERKNEMSRRSEQLDIAVVVPTRNRPSDLRRCLASLAAAPPPRCSVTVVDQSTDMESAAVFKELVGGLDAFDYVASDRTGVSIARNQGARSVGGDLVLFIDDDCEVTRRLGRSLAAVLRGTSHG